MKTIERIPQLDAVRSVCMLWVVALWHINDYMIPDRQYSPELFSILGYATQFFLATFTYLSGFLLGKYQFESVQDAVIFYKKRIIRIYPLFLCASILFLIMNGSLRDFIYTVLGLSLIFPPSLSTLWYISMLMICYFLTPILKFKYQSVYLKVVVPLIITSLITFGYVYLNFDLYLLLYFPFYILGLYTPRKFLPKLKSCSIVALSLFVMIILFQLQSSAIVLRMLFCCAGVVFLLSFCFSCHIPQWEPLFSKVSYCSLCAYLFHRPIIYGFIVLRKFMGGGNIGIDIPQAVFILIFVFIFSYYIQKKYDCIFQSVNNKSNE